MGQPRTPVPLADDAALWEEFSAPVRAFVRRRVPPDLDVEDVVQDVFLRLLRHLDTLGDVERLDAWVFQVARSAVTDALRAHRRRALRYGAVEPDDLADASAADAPDATFELTPCLTPFVRQLAPPYREALEMTALGGLTQQEAARSAGISLSGMKSRVQRAREQLRGEFLRCCAVQLDARGGIMDVEPRPDTNCAPAASFHTIQRPQR